ncbi:phosphoribosyltransferase-like protein [Scleroderma citrinum]
MSDVEFLRNLLTQYEDFPKPGIGFVDIFPLLRNPLAFETLITHFIHHIVSHTIPRSVLKKVDVVVGLDARGFLLGPIIALRLGAAFVPVRKKGKLPGPCVSVSYEKEYGVDMFEMQKGAIQPGQNVIVVDDLIATGGSAKAAGQLVEMQGGTVLEYLFIIEVVLSRDWQYDKAPIYSIVQYN